jgi:hypothetical protein
MLTGSSRGEKPADLPVQMPTKYDPRNQFEVGQGAIGPAVPLTLLGRADEVID